MRCSKLRRSKLRRSKLRCSTLRRGASAAALALLLAACGTTTPPGPPRDAAVPPFAREGWAPFTRAAAIEIALREWRLFGSPVEAPPEPGQLPGAEPEEAAEAATPERAEGLWQRIGEYWWLGLDGGEPERRYTGKHDAGGRVFPAERDGAYAWSAAFVSYVMRMAGAGPRFPYSGAHFTYINAARRGTGTLAAVSPALYAPEPGDLICHPRGADAGLRFEDLPRARFVSHCDIVVGREPGVLVTVGGNVQDAVRLRRLPVTPDGRLAGRDGVALDPAHPWFAVIRVRYDG